MDIIFKAVAGALISVVLSMVVGTHHKEIATLLSAAVCCMIAAAMLTYLRPSLAFFEKLSVIGNLDQEAFSILLKSTGIALLAEITGLICADAGNSTIGKVLQMLAAVVILWLSLPLLETLIDVLDEIVGSL